MNNVKRIVSALVGFPLIVLIFILGNVYVIDIAFAILAEISIYEYLHAFKSTGKANPISWCAYVFCLLIAVIHLIPSEYLSYIIAIVVPLMIVVMFMYVIFSNMKYSPKDVAVTVLGICYVGLFFAFIPMVYGLEKGKFYIWYTIIISWGTDIFAYIVGRRIGKHKFSQISPNKSIEGCIAGTLAAVILAVIYTVILNCCFAFNINYFIIVFMSFILSLIGQIGDFSASSIKRYVGVKDYSNLIPGHGGMLDRFDSLIFIAPFAYFLLMII